MYHRMVSWSEEKTLSASKEGADGNYPKGRDTLPNLDSPQSSLT